MEAREDGMVYVEDLTMREFAEFLRDHGRVEKRCRYCNNSKWDIPETNGKPTIINLPTPKHHEDGLNALFISCASCGQIETFLAQTVISKIMGWV